ncbi:MAG: hypothetical protein J6Y84_04570 [Bacteroidaceae bacterium]|nr:hypothetical protein [Bacteroidaceae bacterium]
MDKEIFQEFASQVLSDAFNGNDREHLPERVNVALRNLEPYDDEETRQLQILLRLIQKAGNDPEKAYHEGLLLRGLYDKDVRSINEHQNAIDELNFNELMQSVNTKK